MIVIALCHFRPRLHEDRLQRKSRFLKMNYYIYILSSKKNGTLYIGVTANLSRRVSEHKNENGASFSKKYKIFNLVYYEVTSNIKSAIKREKQLKKWNRKWKIELIEKENPEWCDLYNEIIF